MKPLKLEFQAFGPYINHEVIDFEGLTDKKLFLICGETGSGKTMILDAMTFALYGKEKSDARSDLDELRCTQAAFGEDTFVRFTFSNNGEKYLFERKLVCKSKNFSKQQNVFKIDEAGNMQVVFENCKDADINSYAEEVIGLTRDQFRQIIILPQGKFESFLLAKSDDKQEILSNIFDVKKWKSISDLFFKNADEELKRVNGYQTTINNRIEVYDCETADAFYAQVEGAIQQREALKEAYQKAGYKKKLENAEKEKETAKQFANLHTKESELKALEQKKSEIEASDKKLKLSQKAQNVKPFADAYASANRELSERCKKAEEAATALEAAKKAKDTAEKELKAHQEKKAAFDKKAQEKAVLESKEPIYLQIDSVKKKCEAAKADFEAVTKNCDKQAEKHTKAREALETQIKLYNESSSKYLAMFNLYNDGISGELASSLEDNEPCPICGSLSHPNPAKKLESAPTRNELDEAKNQLDKLHEAWNTAEQNEAKEKEALKEKEKKLNECSTAFELAKKDVENTNKNQVEGIDSHSALIDKIAALKTAIDEYEQKTQALSQGFDSAKAEYQKCTANVNTAKSEVADAQKALKTAEQKLKTALDSNSFETLETAKQAMLTADEQEEIRQNISDYKAAVSQTKKDIGELKNALEGKPEKDMESILNTIQEINDKIGEYNETKAALDVRIEQMTKTKNEIEELNQKFKDEIQQAQDDFTFAKALRGDTGIGIQRYVLAIMFNKVIAEANKMLKNVHGGRFHLFRSDDKVAGSNKRGLNLKVHDNYSPEKDGRNVALLSGGEKFLVSLSLAIGMSAVAQKSGVKIEAMFIDEGFGTLDEKSIDDALDVLQSVQKANGVVGIISHVQVLEDNISEKLEIVKSNTGSTIRSTF
ncbi:MAG: SMC family ATPase [Clostridia bacterium]|nr:SMC family ATPase [Clostridia bacterium]